MQRDPNDVVIVAHGGETRPDDRYLMWRCAGCKKVHNIKVRGTAEGNAMWGWNGSTTSPTVQPSILKSVEGNNPIRCHSFVTDGKVRFLADCDHELAGQEVAMKTSDADPFNKDEDHPGSSWDERGGLPPENW